METAGGALGSANGPPLVELIGYVPEDVLEGLHLTPGQLSIDPSATSGVDLVSSETTLVIPSRPNSVEAALARGLLPRLLANRNARVALSDSQSALLESFGRGVPRLAAAPRGAADLQRTFEGRGLSATSFDGGSIELLRRLDHPVVLPLAARPPDVAVRSASTALLAPSDPGGAPADPGLDERWVAITGFKGDRARVAGLVSDQVVTIAIDELESHWLETGIIVWERYEPVPSVLVENDEGEGVLWLQRSLAELHFFDGSPTGRFDDTTLEAVRRFQDDRGLVSDGVAGPLTQIALYARLGRYPVPRLSRASVGAETETDTNGNIDGVATTVRSGDRG